MTIRFLLTISALLCFSLASAQKMSWKKHVKKAEERIKAGDLETAATHYSSAWQLKQSKTELAYKAGQCYRQLHEYRKAAEAFSNIKTEIDDFPQIGILYAQCLKQDGQYQKARMELVDYKMNYQGKDKAQVEAQIAKEIAGCDLAKDGKTDESIKLERLNNGINTIENEFAPLPFNDDILYFSSTAKGFSQIYRSHFQNGSWSPSVLPKFPQYKDLHVAHGSFTPDNSRFYFTLCKNENFDPVQASCDIYVTVLQDNEWSTPKKLRDYIKLEGKTATHPFVIHQGNQEILYFASDRKGGQGGLDIWYMTRHVDSPEYDFTLPQNAGPQVNTTGDEITPFYDQTEEVLYFSTNGRASIGGFDVYKIAGQKNSWKNSEPLSRPYNSAADDYYFVLNPGRSGGFLSSNRLFGLEKITTRENDIFQFLTPRKEVLVSGNVYDKSNSSILTEVQIILYEVKGSGRRRMLQSIIADNGLYQFPLVPNRKFLIEAEKRGYANGMYEFDTYNFNPEKDYGKAIYLAPKNSISQVETPVLREEDSTASIETIVEEPKVTTTSPAASTTYVNSLFQGNEVTTTAPKTQGTYYKVQISTATQYDSSDPQFDSVRNFGRMDTETITAKKWIRVLLADFYSLREAKTVMDQARALGFPEAFVVKYRNGKRL